MIYGIYTDLCLDQLIYVNKEAIYGDPAANASNVIIMPILILFETLAAFSVV